MPDLTGVTILMGTCASLIWFALRAWRLKSTVLRWTAAGLASLSAIVASLLVVLSISGLSRAHARSAPVPDLKITATAARIQRGQAIVDSFCSACHSKTDRLTGGRDMGKDLSIPIGSFVSSNLTPAGQLRHWSDGEIFRAIRNGIDVDGRWLVIMSYTNTGKLSDEDVESVIVYLRSQPAAGAETVNPPDQFSLLGLVMLGSGLLPTGKPVFTGVVTAARKAPTAEYGEYISRYQDCRECHGADLNGGKPGQVGPIGPGLNLVTQWKLQEFIDTMRTGTDPYGHHLGDQMPWRFIGRMDDEELTALYEFLTHGRDSRSAAAN
jgi:mono/diheme cytochrome c family protein